MRLPGMPMRDVRPTRRGLLVLAIVTGAYVVVALLVQRYVSPSVATDVEGRTVDVDQILLGVAPIAIAAWVLGLRGGTVFMALATPIFLALAALDRDNLADVVRFAGAVPFVLVAAAPVVGGLRETSLRLEARAQEQERLLRALSDLGEGFAAHDGKAFVYVNDAFCAILGRDRERILGAQGMEFVLGDDRARVARITDDTGAIEARLTRPDGSVVIVEAAIQPVGRPGPGRVMLLRDITQRRREEAALRQQERLATMGTLLAGVAHEINNPLSYMALSVELVEHEVKAALKSPGVEGPARDALDQALEHAQRAQRGVKSVRDIAGSLKRVARAGPARRAPEDVNILVESSLLVAGPRLKHDVQVETRLDATQRVSANGGEISQVILNLLLNAADALRGRADARLVVSSRDEADRVVVEVEDNGPGIPAEMAPGIFQPFQTTKEEGTGLGLSLSKRIVEEHGGALGFSSEPGRGATFRVSLPAASHSLSQSLM